MRKKMDDDDAEPNWDETPLSCLLFWVDPEVGLEAEVVEVEEAPLPFEVDELEEEEVETRAVPPTAFGFETSKS